MQADDYLFDFGRHLEGDLRGGGVSVLDGWLLGKVGGLDEAGGKLTGQVGGARPAL